MPLEVEHIIPRSWGGSDRVANLTISCRGCNQKKNNQTAAEFGYPHLQAQAKQPLKDAAAVNSIRYTIGNRLKSLGLPMGFWSGGRTKHNRIRQGYEKDHWLDAACVGESGAVVTIPAAHHQGDGTRQPVDVPGGQVRFSPEQTKISQAGSRISDRGYGAGYCAVRQKGRDIRGASSCQSQR